VENYNAYNHTMPNFSWILREPYIYIYMSRCVVRREDPDADCQKQKVYSKNKGEEQRTRLSQIIKNSELWKTNKTGQDYGL